MSKDLSFDREASQNLFLGAEQLYNAVKVTLGPSGRNVVIGTGTLPLLTHDGVTVARSIDLPDVQQQQGVELLRQAAKNIERIGDGTTTTTVLAYHLLKEMRDAGGNPMQLAKAIKALLPGLLETLDSYAQDGDLEAIATISAGDPEVGGTIADLVTKIGADGLVTIELSNGQTLDIQLSDGYTFDRGYLSPYLVTDTQKMEAVLSDTPILILNAPLSTTEELVHVTSFVEEQKLVLIAPSIESAPLSTLISSKQKGYSQPLAINAPGYGPQQLEILEDLAALTGATVVSPEDVTASSFGKAVKVISTSDQTTIIGEAPQEYLVNLAQRIDNAESSFDTDLLKDRLAKLTQTVATIKVGGKTEAEAQELLYRIEDAVGAAQAALKEGTVPGGETTLVNLANTLGDTIPEKVMATALKEPFRQLLLNAGINPDPLIANVAPNFGYDVNNPDHAVDLRAKGIIDPKLVTKEALLNAVSVATTIITAGAVITDHVDE